MDQKILTLTNIEEKLLPLEERISALEEEFIAEVMSLVEQLFKPLQSSGVILEYDET